MDGNDNVSAAGSLSQRARRLIERLKSRKGRVREGLVLVEGVRAVGTALDGGMRIRLAIVSDRLVDRTDGAALLERLASLHADVRRVQDDALGSLSDTETPQGVLVVGEERGAPLDELRPGCWLVLDAVQDPGNAGTLVRAAAAFGVDGVIALGGTVDLWGAKAVRASAGLVYRVPLARTNVGALVARCRDGSVDLLVADADGVDVASLGWERPIALVVGNEGAGVREALVRSARRTVAVPMSGPADSLNVGIAGSILLYALSTEQRRA